MRIYVWFEDVLDVGRDVVEEVGDGDVPTEGVMTHEQAEEMREGELAHWET